MRYPVNYIAITQGLHYGKCIDFGWSNAYGGKNQPVFACDDGVVYRIENQKNGGNVIYIEHKLGNKVSNIKNTGKIAWGILIGGVLVAATAIVSSKKFGKDKALIASSIFPYLFNNNSTIELEAIK